MDAADGTGEEFCDGEDGHVGHSFVFGAWNGVGNHNFLNVRAA